MSAPRGSEVRSLQVLLIYRSVSHWYAYIQAQLSYCPPLKLGILHVLLCHRALKCLATLLPRPPFTQCQLLTLSFSSSLPSTHTPLSFFFQTFTAPSEISLSSSGDITGLCFTPFSASDCLHFSICPNAYYTVPFTTFTPSSIP